MSLQFELSGSQIDGARDYQEDAFLINQLTDADGNSAALIIIADGMGGHAAGNVASNMAVQAINKHISSNYPADKPSDLLHECVIKANNSIKETVKETPALSGMGCTMVVAILETGKIWWASVGDSHLYLIRNKELKKINADHSYGGFLDRMAAAGTPIEAEPGLSRNMLMSAITGDEIDEIDVSTEPLALAFGDRILLCSDGMDTLSAGKLTQFSDWSDSPKECVEALLNAVKDAAMPKQDNTTIVVVDVKENITATASAPTSVPAEPTPIAQAAAVQSTAPQPASQPPFEDDKKGKSGLVIGIAAIVLIAIAIGGYMLFSGQQMPSAPISADSQQESSSSIASDEDEIIANVAETETATPEAVTPAEPVQQTVVASASDSEFRDSLRDGTPGPAMIIIPAGEFDMGSPGTSGNADERPRRTVMVNSFAISKYEITFAEYEKFAQATGRRIPDNLYMEKDVHPVIFVNWDDAFYYARWLSDQTGNRYSLPTESQWEYAAGTGVRSPFWWGYEEEPNRAHCFGCGTGLDPRKPTRIGSFQPNQFGVYDTNGNVAEWVRDCWHDNYNNAPLTAEVWEGGDCSVRVVRGGSYSTPPQSIRHTKRDKFRSDAEYDNIGIRLVRELD